MTMPNDCSSLSYPQNSIRQKTYKNETQIMSHMFVGYMLVFSEEIEKFYPAKKASIAFQLLKRRARPEKMCMRFLKFSRSINFCG